MPILALIFSSSMASASGPDTVTTYKDSKGWKLQVNGEDFFVKGVVWGYIPRKDNYKYNLFALPDDQVKAIIDHEFGLMQKAGVNAVRSFTTIPPEWVTYINDTYGIKTAINPLMGRYGLNVAGLWIDNPDYSDPLTRETMKREVLEQVEKYKDVRGVLMFAFGNESNYGLSWSSFEIENLPVGEQQAAKAEHLYSLFGEVIAEARQIAPNHLFTIVNGDIQYLDLIARYGKDWDMLGSNAYRGATFTSLWKDVQAGLGLPVLFFEFGSDAFNARDMKEAQLAQAEYLKSQWQDMYNNSYGRGYGNSIGGFVFEWRDEWWKFNVEAESDLHRHNTNASWVNGGYKFDHVEGQNNMNEEWFGITRLGDVNDDGVFIAEPRIAYDTLAEVWKVDPYSDVDIDTALDTIDLESIAAVVEERDAANDWGADVRPFRLAGGELRLDTLMTRYDQARPASRTESGSDVGQMLFLDFEFQPTSQLTGEFTVNMIGTSALSDFEFRYGDRVHRDGDPHIELYDFQATYRGDGFTLDAFYHTPRYHWGYKGDFFGLLRETTDIDGPNGQDIWNAKAPYGIEFDVKSGRLAGLTVVAGEEIYWGANPKVLLKYQFGPGKQYTFMHSEDYDDADPGSNSGQSTVTTEPKRRQTTLQGKFDLDARTQLQLGAIISGTRRLDDQYQYVDNTNIKTDTVKFADTIGTKGRLAFDVADNSRGYVAFHYAGIVADGGEPLKELGPDSTGLPYAQKGNKRELEAGISFVQGNYTIFPRVLYRDNLVDANPLIPPTIIGGTLNPGVRQRNVLDDPFAVLDNREARSAEVFFTFDPTPGTPFYDWDNDLREDASVAYNIGFTASRLGATDSEIFFLDSAGRNIPFGQGLPKDDVWLLKSKVVLNPTRSFKTILKAEVGKQQPTGVPLDLDGGPVKATEYWQIGGKMIFNREHIVSASFKKDAWGPYDFQREFNIKYPEQFELEYVRLLDKGLSEKDSSQFGIKGLYRTLDAYSPPDYALGLNDYMYEFQAFYKHKF